MGTSAAGLTRHTITDEFAAGDPSYRYRANAAYPHAHRRTRELGTVLDLEPPARQIIALAGAVADDMLPAPTPCGDYTVKDLLAHFMGLTIAFRDAAASAEPGQRGPFGTAVEVAPDAPVLDRAVGLSGRDPNWPSERS
jgi:hypothetical protein